MLNIFNKSKIKEISPTQAQEEISNNKDIYIVDVREPSEYRMGHIENSLLIPLSDASEIEDKITDKNAKIIVHCQGGIRSKTACSIFSKLGYTDVLNMTGGISAWNGNVVK